MNDEFVWLSFVAFPVVFETADRRLAETECSRFRTEGFDVGISLSARADAEVDGDAGDDGIVMVRAIYRVVVRGRAQ